MWMDTIQLETLQCGGTGGRYGQKRDCKQDIGINIHFEIRWVFHPILKTKLRSPILLNVQIG